MSSAPTTSIAFPEAHSPAIEAFWHVRSADALAMLRFLPSGCCDLVLNLGASLDEAGSALRVPSGDFLAVGPFDGPALFSAAGEVDLFGIRLAVGQAHRLLGDAVTGLARAALPADGQILTHLSAALRACRDDQTRMRVAQHVLDDACFDTAADDAVAAFVAMVGASEEPLPLSAVARELDLSERQLERRVWRAVGLPPKRYARVARFNRALALLDRGDAGLAEIAAGSGYADQAHFTREFAMLAGMTPGSYRRAARVGFLQYG